MKIVRFRKGHSIHYGIVEGAFISELLRDPFTHYELSGKKYPLEEITMLAPCQPSKIVALGLNYRSHALEVKMKLPEDPMLFLKPSTAVIGPGEEIIYPAMSRRVDYEAELGVVIAKETKNVSENEAGEYILGYTCFNDVTARDLQGKDTQFTRAKGFDTFAPMGPWIETELIPANLKVEARLNGELRQSGNTADLVFPVFQLVSFISKVMTLVPGDLIATGTPSGIGPMQAGDVIEISVEGIGTLHNRVANS